MPTSNPETEAALTFQWLEDTTPEPSVNVPTKSIFTMFSPNKTLELNWVS
ncbi:hypothetical protein N5P32_08935 [Marinomonas pontica]|nr:hypothetical protein [Marinomonas pontica]MCW8356008.1 hypothetical protein [Marinomonas pontica]